MIATSDLIEIVEKASSLSERLSDRFCVDDAQPSEAFVTARLERWCQVAAKGNLEEFAKRLSWDGLDSHTLRRALGTVKLTQQSLPEWTEALTEAMNFATALSPTVGKEFDHSQYPYLTSEKPVPFEELLIPFVEIGRAKLRDRLSSDYSLISEAAFAQLERSFLEQLVGLCAFSLELEFSIFRTLQTSTLVQRIGQLQDCSARLQYIQFVQSLLKDGFLKFFQEYSVLARLMATALNFWVDSTAEFLLRLAADWQSIQTTFAQEALGQVVAIETALSDPHNCGRSVLSLTFASSLKLIYKPKDLGLEQSYFKLLSWLNQQGTLLPFKLLKVINQSTHGWMEFAETTPAKDLAEIERFYRRAGMVLGIVYLLRGTDCHYENLLACGDQPVLVDLETLLHHRTWATPTDADAPTLANERLQDSVAGTALLPGWQLVPYGQGEGLGLDLSGLGGSSEQQMPYYRALKWQHVNTDSMTIGHESTRMRSKQNRPFADGATASAADYGAEIVEGFQQIYQFCIQHREALLAPDSPIAAFAHQKVRLVFRNTSVYFTLLRQSLNPKFLRNGADFSIEFEVLSRAFLTSETKHPFWALLAAEQQALEQLDIPYFAAYSDSDALLIRSDRSIDQFLTQPSYSDVVSRLQRLSESDLAQQIQIIHGSLYSCVPYESHCFTGGNQLENKAVNNQVIDSVESVLPELFIQQATAIAQELQQRAIHGMNNSVTWIGMGYVPEARRFQFKPIGYSLYDGCCGVALFLAALAAITQNEEFGDLGLKALQPLLKALQTANPRQFSERLGIGGGTGLGSIIYTLVKVAELLDRKPLVQAAEQAANLAKEYSGRYSLDIITGTAGTILGLLTLHRVSPDSGALAQATAWGKQILADRSLSETGHHIWTKQEQPLIGFLEGTVGIAYALLRLYAVTQDPLFLDASEEAIAYERSCFLTSHPTLGNLPSEVVGNRAIDLALAHWGSVSIAASSETYSPTDSTVNSTIDSTMNYIEAISLSFAQQSLQSTDSFCHGNFKDIELLLIASQQAHLRHRLKNLHESCSCPERSNSSFPEQSLLLEVARRQAVRVLGAGARDFHLLPNLSSEVYVPGFFHGTAGIGYELLRLAAPNQLPSVLLWQ